MKVAFSAGAGGMLAALALLLAGPTAGRGEATGAAATHAVEARAEIVVSLSGRRLRMMVGGEEVAAYPIAVGKAGHETPTGSFRIRRIIWNPSWRPPDAPWARGRKPTPPGDPDNPMGRAKIFFAEPDYYIHGTGEEGSLGRAASHGCIRMRNDDVIALAKLLMEHGGESRPPSWFRQVINRATDTREVRLQAPVSMRVRA
jgi:murein L,D-transpeptidase YcbB/YkuD